LKGIDGLHLSGDKFTVEERIELRLAIDSDTERSLAELDELVPGLRNIFNILKTRPK
jgi:hypothetical protein